MNIFRILADSTHAVAIIYLLWSIFKTKSYAGISAKTQLLYSVVFVTRYLDLFLYFISYYNTTLKVVFILASTVTFLLVIKYSDTYDKKNDSFCSELMIIGAMVLALYFNHQFTAVEVLWTFSQYLEAVTILPQIYLIKKSKTITHTMSVYLLLLAVYKLLYCGNWVYRFANENFYDPVADAAGVTDVLIFVLSMIILRCSGVKIQKENEDGYRMKQNIFFINFDYGQQHSVTPDIAPLAKEKEIV